MDDRELATVAAFKLREAANRMLTLAEVTGSARLRIRLLSLAKLLIRHERRFYEFQSGAALGGDAAAPTAPPAARSAG